MKEVWQYRIVEDDSFGTEIGDWQDIYNGLEEYIGAFTGDSKMEFRRINRGTCGTCGTGNVEFPIAN